MAQYQSWDPPYPVQSAEALVREMEGRRLDQPGWTQIGIELRATASSSVTWPSRTADASEAAVGYSLAPAHWGHGYATEAVGAVVAHGLDALGFDVIVAEVVPENAASIAVLTRLGFAREGPLPHGDDRYVRRRSPEAPRRSP